MFKPAAASMTAKPCQICRLGVILPALLPDSHEPVMMPLTVTTKNQKNWVGCKCRIFPRNDGADRMYRNRPLNGMPEASASSMKRGSNASNR